MTSPDPFDLEALRQVDMTDVNLETVMTTVPVRKPNRTEFIRVNRDPAYVVEAMILEHVSGLDRESYWITPGLIPMLGELVEETTRVRLHTAINKHGVTFLWPCKLPRDDNPAGRAWAVSALRAAEQAKELWVKVLGNKHLGAYEYVKALGDLGDPDWPSKSFKELISMGFDGKVIATLEHPVIRELNGEI